MAHPSAAMNIMMAAARKAGRKLARDFGEVEHLQVSKKGPADFVTAADMVAEKIIFEHLSENRPGYGFLMEERGDVAGTDRTHRFIVDPLDGTLNFMHGLPHFAVSIGLERDGEIVMGLVYDVIKDEMFWAEKGRGAYINDRRLRVSARKHLSDAVFATGIPFLGKPGHASFVKELFAVMSQVAGVRRFGSAALDLAYVAAGRYDGFWERNLKPWDTAGGAILVREAGGYVTDIDGDGDPIHTGNILAGPPTLLGKLQTLLKSG
ncbi:MAG: inositol monophosphatase family protein [Maricaulaceae bacterium]